MEGLFAPFLNLLILVGLLAYKLRAPLREFVSNRHHSIRHEIQSVSEQLRAAQNEYNELNAKLKAVDSEVSELRLRAQEQAQASQARIAAEARRLSTTIVSDAKSSEQGLYEQLKADLHAELTSKVLDKAEILLTDRLTGDDQSRFRQEFSQQVERFA